MSRRLHEEVVGLLRAQIEELRDEKKRLADVIFEQVNGKPLYAAPLTPTVEPVQPKTEIVDDPVQEAARKVGSGGKARALVMEAQKIVNNEYMSETQRAAEAARAAMKQAEEQGRAAANPVAVN